MEGWADPRAGAGAAGRLPLEMGRVLGHFLTPAAIGLGAVRHIAWYVSYQMSGETRG
ncbi:MAG: hypothetical protein BroJett022_00530 [Actinomycetes bacterium]|nr:MAG: hypothetical protein BroJett022_00530 [Actinomycetes bacterium]